MPKCFPLNIVQADNLRAEHRLRRYFSDLTPVTPPCFLLNAINAAFLFRLNPVNTAFFQLNAVNAATFLVERCQRRFFVPVERAHVPFLRVACR